MKKWFSFLVVILFLLGGGGASAQEGIYWSAEKKGVYQPLYPYTLSWSDDVLKDGGFDVETESIVKDRTMADLIINVNSSIGARKISGLSTFKELIDRKSFRFPTDGFGDPRQSATFQVGDVFVIEASDGKYVQIRIDQKSANAVHFTYVIEEEKPVDPEPVDPNPVDPVEKDFTQKPQKPTKDPMKEWKVTFSKPVNPATVTSQTVYVKDSSGKIFESTPRVSSDGLIVYVAPRYPYNPLEKYTIYISKEVKSAAGTNLKTGVSMPFVVEADDDNPDEGWHSGLVVNRSELNPYRLYVTWLPSRATNLAGYRLYYRTEGTSEFVRLLDYNDQDYIIPTNEVHIDIKDKSIIGKNVEFYVTLEYWDEKKESARSDINTHLLVDYSGGSGGLPVNNEFFGTWNLELAYVDFGTLTINSNGTYTRTGGPEGNLTGTWEIRPYGFTLVNADNGRDYVVQSYPVKGGIKLLTVTDGKWTDGSPITLYYVEGKR
ncbi:hypothetical protein OXB_1569 [Bacillus sp. OxB-1]|uniref:Ig-like domain-containing protein n=1 Tax=Bacillus sp. (strain OxB-1) TaxID=98228 RepID=UPI000581ED1A|nr:Ig-like domain-containing protein [Bacillus sp. OxB-1]BAQ10040.1 hypothetical protein OXB_1569 [Bacillus sp. OxB-1]